MRDSYTFAITGITETGLKSEGSLADEDFRTGVTFASFQLGWGLATNNTVIEKLGS